jgi:hypothetical protein
VPKLEFVKFDKNTRLDALGVLLTFNIQNHVYLEFPPERRQLFEKNFYVDNYSWPVGFAGGASSSNVNSSAVEGSDKGAGSSDELSFVKRRVLFIRNSQGVDGWAKPLFKVGLDQAIWRSLPTSLNIISQPEVVTESISQTYIGGRAPPKDCSQLRVSDMRNLMIDFGFYPPK